MVIERSKRAPIVAAPRKANKLDIKVLEAAVLAALRMADVRKALQMLNSAPIAPKTEATLRCLRDLHPRGPIPTPIPIRETPHFTGAALNSFGPGSAAGLFGFKPSLLQQAVRAETFNFGSQLARCVNQFASGAAPDFLIPFVAGGVSIALEKSATARLHVGTQFVVSSVSVSALRVRRKSVRALLARTTLWVAKEE